MNRSSSPPPLPTELLTLGRRIVRPRDAAQIYVNPRSEFRRLARGRALRHIAHGYYLIPPQEAIADPIWRPPVEHLALGVAAADHPDRAALAGLSAARYHDAVPRASAAAWIASQVSRRPLDCGAYGRIIFVRRHVAQLDLVRATTPIADGWVTSIEQTIVDLARQTLNDPTSPAWEAILALWPRADQVLVDELAHRQRARSAIARLRAAIPQ